MSIEQQARAYIDRFAAGHADVRRAMAEEGAALASSLVRTAMDLGYSKATEFSPRIAACQLLAAKVALLAHWPDEEPLARFERGVFYYRSQNSPIVPDYEAFRTAYVDAGVVSTS